jgi:hypothetical protein
MTIASNRAKKPPRGLTIADVEFTDGTPRCGHCGRVLPASSRIELERDAIVATCPHRDCGCWTPFPIVRSA